MGLPTPFARTFPAFSSVNLQASFSAPAAATRPAVCAAHDHSKKRAEAVASVLLDRMVGLVATLFVGCALLLPRLEFFAGHPEARPALLCMGAFLCGAVAFLALFFARHLFERNAWLHGSSNRAASVRSPPLLRRLSPFGITAASADSDRLRSPTWSCWPRPVRLGARVGIAAAWRDLFAVDPVIVVWPRAAHARCFACAKTLTSIAPPFGLAAGPPEALASRLSRRPVWSLSAVSFPRPPRA
jgi:hypothetical protein